MENKEPITKIKSDYQIGIEKITAKYETANPHITEIIQDIYELYNKLYTIKRKKEKLPNNNNIKGGTTGGTIDQIKTKI